MHIMAFYGIIVSTPRERSDDMTNKLPGKSAPTPEQWAWFEAHLTHEIRKRLFNEAYRILLNKSDAEDVLQDAIQIGASNLSRLRDEDKFFSWMFKIVHREAIHHLVREKKMTNMKATFLLFKGYYESGATPDKLVISKEERERLRREIDQLKSPEKEILLLKLTTRKSLKEIAAELGLNYHTTRSKFNRTCSLIKKKLEAEGGDGSHEKK